MKKAVTIARAPGDSPNMTSKDTGLLQDIATELKAMGATVVEQGENESIPADAGVICSMSRTETTLQSISEAELRGISAINTPAAVRNCSRKQFMELLQKSSVPQPEYKLLHSQDELMPHCYPCWIKQAEGWSRHKDDVCHASTKAEAEKAIEQMRARGHREFIQMQHCEGDIVKFYAVGESFFHWYYPNAGSSKFGLEVHNGTQHHHPFNAARLQEIAHKAAKATGVTVYGGDCIVTKEGDIYIIDINDFPSFSPVRSEAAKEIAKLIIDKLYER